MANGDVAPLSIKLGKEEKMEKEEEEERGPKWFRTHSCDNIMSYGVSQGQTLKGRLTHVFFCLAIIEMKK